MLLTAKHVLDDHLNALKSGSLSENVLVFVLPGLGCGAVKVDQRYFPRILHCFTMLPFEQEIGIAEARCVEPRVLDISKLKVDFSEVPNLSNHRPLKLEFSSEATNIGEQVLVVGFGEIDILWNSGTNRIPDGMLGSVGIVRGKHPHGFGLTAPMPALEIEGDFRRGMSGGPVFNQQGKVIGLLNASIEPTEFNSGVGWAADLGVSGILCAGP